MKICIFLLSLSAVLLLHHKLSFSQQPYHCGTVEMHQLYEQTSPGYLEGIQQAEGLAQNWLNTHKDQTRDIITIPVVVHVVWHTNSQKITEQQVKSQIDVLNEDYRRQNQDTSNTPGPFKSLGADCMIEFCLAAVDPNGDTTSGIEYTFTEKTIFSLGDSIKSAATGGADPWPAQDYLNIWTCNLGDNVLGYATLPSPNISKNDGVVVLYKAFGREGILQSPYNLGRTCTHEVGHWLGLSHIWGDDGGTCSGSDGISDTPNQADRTFGCPGIFPLTDDCSPNDPGIMYMNYMDYTDDDCMNLFTHGQSDKMNATLNTTRSSIQTSPGGCQGIVFGNDASISKIIFPIDQVDSLSFQPQVQVTNRGLNTLTNLHIEYQVDGQDPATFEYSGSLVSKASEVVTLPLYFTGEGDHIFTAWCENPNGSIDEYPFNDTTTSEFTVVSNIPKNSITINPVPTDGQITFTVRNPSAADLELLVVNSIGQIVQKHFISLLSGTTGNLDLSDLNSGIYFLYGKIGYDYISNKVMVWR